MGNAGVVDQNIDAAKAFADCGKKIVNRFRIAYITCFYNDANPGRIGQSACGVFEGRSVTCHEREITFIRNQRRSDRQSNAPAGAGNNCDLVAQSARANLPDLSALRVLAVEQTFNIIQFAAFTRSGRPPQFGRLAFRCHSLGCGSVRGILHVSPGHDGRHPAWTMSPPPSAAFRRRASSCTSAAPRSRRPRPAARWSSGWCRNLRRQPLLHLQATGKNIHQPRSLLSPITFPLGYRLYALCRRTAADGARTG